MADDLSGGAAVIDKVVEAPVTAPVKEAPATDVTSKEAPVTGADTGGDKAVADGTGTLLDDAGKAADGKGAPVGQWPEDWRKDIVGHLGLTEQAEIDKELKILERMASPADVYKKAREAERKLSSGQVKKALPANATPEQIAEWRKDNGIPEKPDAYVIPEVKGHEWSDDDKAIAGQLFGALHEANVPQSAADAVLKWYPSFVAKQTEQIMAVNKQARDATEDALRKEFGNDYRPNVQLLGRLFQDKTAMPEAVARAFTSARHPDGRILLNDPEVASFLVSLARQQYGDGAILTGEQESVLSSREEELIKIRNTNIDRFNSETNAKGELLSDELLNIRRAKARSAR